MFFFFFNIRENLLMFKNAENVIFNEGLQNSWTIIHYHSYVCGLVKLFESMILAEII